MEALFEDLKILISNAKKSLNRPYSAETISIKRSEITTLDVAFFSLEHTETQQKEFCKLKTEALALLEQHSNKKNTNTDKQKLGTMNNMEISELTSIVKLLPIFSGKKDELHNFITNLDIISATIPTEKQISFFNFVFNSRLDVRVQNRVKQISIPETIEELIKILRDTYKSRKTSNTILNELTSIKQKGDNLSSFTSKIESLVSELNEIQIAEEGEEHRMSIVRTNGRIAYNSFVNGLSDPRIISTIDASRVTTFPEAVEIAEKSSSRTQQGQVFFQKSRPNKTRQMEVSKCKKCGRSHGYKCPAQGKECYKCKKHNHFGNMCLTNLNESRNRSSSNNYGTSTYRGNTGRNNNNNRNNNYRGRSINHINDQGNSQNPETIHPGSPHGN